MEELAEDHVDILQQRKNWVKFDEDGNKIEVEVTEDDAAAVINVENGPKKDESKDVVDKSAVIETTQLHVVTKDRRSPTVVPSPAPRIHKEATKATPRTEKNQQQSYAAATSSTSSVVPKDDMTVSATLSTMQVSMSTHQPPVNKHSRANETVIHIPMRDILGQPVNAEMHNISLSDNVANGGTVTSVNSIANAPCKNAGRQSAFANGDILVNLLPQNDRCSWLTRAIFRPELVPEELMSNHLTLTVEEYLSAMEILVNDFRFNCYNICYKRILMAWILLGFLVLLALLFSGIKGVALFGAGVIWLLLNASGIFICMWIKIRLRFHLERCVAQVNKYFIKHKILLGVDDRGKLSCHKVNLIYVYFDCVDCVRKLNEVIENEDKIVEDRNEGPQNKRNDFRARMDIDESDIIITGNTNTRVQRQTERGERLLLRYSQRWVKEYVCKRLDLAVDTVDRQEGDPPVQPRHCVTSRCPCQFIEEHLRYKPRGYEDHPQAYFIYAKPYDSYD
ncbi:hypothetical protein CHUAL_010119 [Chamberlinius hualienensis]